MEGLRALAILAVVAYHARVPGFAGGFVGVDVFFVVSGYLITALLVREAEETGTVDLWDFYARRARRLLPALAVMLAVCAMVAALLYAPLEQGALSIASLASAAYLGNVFFAALATDYLGGAAEAHPLLHTWSLGVEEQLYLVWPLFVIAALGLLRRGGRPSRRRLAGWMLAGAAVSFAASAVLVRTHPAWAFFLSPPRAWEFAAGGLAVLLPPLVRRPGRFGPAARGWLGLAGIVAAAILFGGSTRFPGPAALLPVLATVLVLRAAAVRPEAAPARLLGLRPMREIGRLSYSWYLWHWPVLVFAARVAGPLGLPARLALVALSLALAEVSYRLVENPVRRAPRLDRRRSLAMAAVVTVLGVALSLGWRQAALHWSTLPGQARATAAHRDLPSVYGTGCHADHAATEVDAGRCGTGPEGAGRTMVLFGDSHAAQWHPALARMARDGGWRLISFTKSACPAVDLGAGNQRRWREYPECPRWRNAVLHEVRAIRPDLVVMASRAGYGLGGEEWDLGTRRILGPLIASSGTVAILRDTPYPGIDVPACVARAKWGVGALLDRPCDPVVRDDHGSSAYDALRRAAAAHPNVSVVDMLPYVCPRSPCRLERGGTPLYRDTHHLTAAFAATLAPALAEQLERRPSARASSPPPGQPRTTAIPGEVPHRPRDRARRAPVPEPQSAKADFAPSLPRFQSPARHAPHHRARRAPMPGPQSAKADFVPS